MSENQNSWSGIYEDSGYKVDTLAAMANIDEGSFRKYLRCERTPRKTNFEKMVNIMLEAQKVDRLEFHPSYGYATKEQIERLQSLKIGADYEYLLKQIAEQTRNHGKFK